MINEDFFFQYVRQHLFGGKISPTQFAGLKAILDEWHANHSQNDDRWLAYIFATAYHETDRKIQGIEEYGKGSGKEYGKLDPITGKRYYGRGLVQLTWKDNYQLMQKALNIPFVDQPELALDLANAVSIMFYGMLNGSFEKKHHYKLADFFNGSTANWVNARRIINGLDKANLIAGYGQQFYAAISHTT